MLSPKRALLLGLVLTVPPALAVRADPDLWWHLLAGREIVAHRALPAHDSWSYTAAGAPWIDHEWLPEIFTALAFDLGGSAGLLGLRALGLLVLMAAWLAVVLGRVRQPALALVLVGMLWPFLANLCNLRPQTVTWALVPVVLLLVDRVAAGRRAAPWLLVATVWVWVNHHGGFLFGWGLAGLGLLLCALGWEQRGQAEPGPPGHRWTCLLAAALVAVCPLLNPYGLELLGYIGREMLAPHPDLPEWNPPDAAMWMVLAPAVLLPLVLQLIGRPRLRPTAWVGLAVATFVASRQAKMVALVLIVSAVCSAEPVAALWARVRAAPDGERLDRLTLGWPAAAGLIAGLLYLQGAFFPVGPVGSIPVELRRFPVQAVDWLAAARGGGRLLVPLGWGGLAVYHLHPRFKVSMDGRNTTVYPVPMVNADSAAWKGGQLDLLLASRPEVALVPTGGPIDRALAARTGWRRAFSEPTGTVWVAEGVTLEPPARPPARRDRFP